MRKGEIIPRRTLCDIHLADEFQSSLGICLSEGQSAHRDPLGASRVREAQYLAQHSTLSNSWRLLLLRLRLLRGLVKITIFRECLGSHCVEHPRHSRKIVILTRNSASNISRMSWMLNTMRSRNPTRSSSCLSFRSS